MSVDYTASWTQICNRALGRVGSDTITDLEDGTRTAEYCGRFLPEAIETVLGQWDFKFTRRRMILAQNEDKPLFGFKYQFNLPKDLIRIIEVRQNEVYERPEKEEEEPPEGYNDFERIPGRYIEREKIEGELVPYQIEDDMILTNAESIQIIYICRPDDPNTMPQSVRRAISLTLAYLLSTAITANEQLVGLLMAESQAAIEEAKKRDAQMNFDPYSDGQPFHTEARR